jgi:ornithine decarboxylase
MSAHLKKYFQQYISASRLKKIRTFARNKETPFLVIDLKRIEKNYEELHRAMRGAKIYYAVKANPHDDVLRVLYKKGSYFDIASRFEIDQLLNLGVEPERMSYGNTIKKSEDIAYAYSVGIRLYTTDSHSDVEKIAKHAPGSKVTFRLLFDGEGADWPLSRKFGAHPDMLYRLIKQAKTKGLDPFGVSFHVGSQQRDIGQWDSAIARCRYLFDALKNDHIKLKAINLGGGFPAKYLQPTASTSEYAHRIKQYLKDDFGDDTLEILIEPGRSIVGDSGILFSEVVLISHKSEAHDTRWVYLDVGKFNGLIETLEEAIKYPIIVEGKEKTKKVSPVILAGPTCDSCDILYEKYKYQFPDNLKEGDWVNILSTGAYTTSYSSVNFNGFQPLKVYIFKEETGI